MNGRWRFGDWVTVLGVALLLVWTPAYWAAGPEERAMVDGESFLLPEVRDGDHLELQLIISNQTGAAVTSGPIINVTFRTPEASDDAPPGTVMVEERHLRPMNMASDLWTFEQDHRDVRLYLNETGAILGADTMIADPSASAWLPQFNDNYAYQRSLSVRTGHIPAMPDHTMLFSMLEGRPGDPIEYGQGSRFASLVDHMALARIVWDEHQIGPHQEPTADSMDPYGLSTWHTPQRANRTDAPFAGRTGPTVMYAYDVGYVFWGPSSLYLDQEPWLWRDATVPLGDAWENGLRIEVSGAGPVAITGPARVWSWAHPEFPVPIGFHTGILNSTSDEEEWSFDLVPTAFHRGTEPIPIHYQPHQAPWHPARNHPVEGDIRLQDLGNDTAPWADGRSVADIQRILASERAPEHVRSFLREGAWIAGFAFAQPGSPYEQNMTDSDWLVVLVRKDEVIVLTLEFRGPYGDQELTTQDLCARESEYPPYFATGRLEYDCAAIPQEIDPANMRVLSPAALLARLETNPLVEAAAVHELPYRQARYLPSLGTITTEQTRPACPESGMHNQTMADGTTITTSCGPPAPARTYNKTFEVRPAVVTLRGTDAVDLGAFMISEAGPTHVLTASMDPRSGKLGSAGLQEREPAQYFGSSQPLSRGSPTTDITILNPLDPSVAAGGLLLVAVGLVVRLIATMKSGALVPFLAALYAKLSRDDALDHERRQRLVALVEADPGLPLAEAARRAGLHRTVAYHHLETLRRNEVLVVTRLGRARHYYPAHVGSQFERLRLAALQHDAWADCIRAIEAKPGITVGELADAMGSGKSSVSKTTRRLTDLGVLTRREEGRCVRLFLAAPTKRADSSN